MTSGCARTEPEEALRQAVAEVQQSIESRDAGTLRRYLAEDFIGPGAMDRDQARRTAALYMMQHQSVGLTMGPLEIQLQEPHATVRFSAALTGGAGRLLPDRANLYQVETGWRMEGGDWKITSAKWTRAL
ncbi:nuclear transport factor 2 family protein [Luteimonas qiangzhengi]|uniref:nuclear transport factor 2 family protein n=1 Tax=Luteimonas sp. MJ146 TaxID=3129240 RepID=UPI0031BA7FA8